MTWTPPIPLAEGYSLEPVDKVLRTDMEAGSPRVRVTSRAKLDHLTFNWRFSKSDMALFREWYRADLVEGSSWFELQVDIGNGVLETKSCRFLETWKASRRVEGMFDVSARVEVRDA